MSFQEKHKTRSEEQAAAKFAVEIQDTVNLRAITSRFVDHMDAMRRSGDDKNLAIVGDLLNNHPVVLAFVSKLNSLTRLTPEREAKAFAALEAMARGEDVTYEVIPL